ncbi:MAG TPA: hypothetical protein PK867_14635, partial [Pirellulales bacterium]|nr:hypothetical protein [Pirellulales bacterium]
MTERRDHVWQTDRPAKDLHGVHWLYDEFATIADARCVERLTAAKMVSVICWLSLSACTTSAGRTLLPLRSVNGSSTSTTSPRLTLMAFAADRARRTRPSLGRPSPRD